MTDLRKDLLILGAAALVTLVAFTIMAPRVGITIDEGQYIFPGRSYVDWTFTTVWAGLTGNRDALAKQIDNSDTAWSQEHTHPPLAKLAYGFFDRLLGGLVGRLVALRIGALFLFLVLQAALYFLIAPRYGRLAGGIALFALLSNPRILVHGFFCEVDMPFATLAVLTTLFFIKGLEKRSWAIATGLVWGLALATKINACFLIVPLVAWGYLFHRRRMLDNLFWMLVIGPIVFVGTWPWLWHETLSRILDYFRFHTNHFPIPSFYFGSVYIQTPWHYPIVTLIASTPLVLLIAAAVSLGRLKKRPLDDRYILLVLLAAHPVLLLMPSSIPAYDNIRLFILTPVVLCGLAGLGGAWAIRRISKSSYLETKKPLVAAALIALLLVPGFIGTLVTHPYQLSYYGAAVGFRSGAVKAGLNLLTWAQVDTHVVEQLEQQYPQGLVLDRNSGVATILGYYQRLGMLNANFRFANNAPYWMIIVANFAYSGFEQWWRLYYDIDPSYRHVLGFTEDGYRYYALYEKL